MEVVKNAAEISQLHKNIIIGNVQMKNSTITFSGEGNVLYCEGRANLNNTGLYFLGSNSLIFLADDSANPHAIYIYIYIYITTVFVISEKIIILIRTERGLLFTVPNSDTFLLAMDVCFLPVYKSIPLTLISSILSRKEGGLIQA